MSFGADSLRIRGTGAHIDAKGWKRLLVILGTGRVHGTDQEIEPKANGIGSKNFGLRSLFLYGDQIYVRSNGRQTLLDLLRGTPPAPVPDLTSRGLPGVRIEVPYRTRTGGLMEPFTQERESVALNGLSSELAAALTKLVRPGGRRNLEEVVVTSERCGRRLRWRQKAERLKTTQKGITVYRRSVRLTDSERPGEERLEEMEFLRTVPVPVEFAGQPIPGYFVVPGGKITIGVSLRTRRGKPDLTHAGTWFYPIGVGHGQTGSAASVNAPFLMDMDRSQILDPAVNRWNEWLLDAAAELAVSLLSGDWWVRFGGDAYLALRRTTVPSAPRFQDQLEKRLREEACWPTRKKIPDRQKRTVFAQASQMVVPAVSALDGFLSPGRYLDEGVASREALRTMLLDAGAASFGINSLVHLRCAGAAGATLQTKIEKGAAAYSYTNYADALLGSKLQVTLAQALDAVKPRLSRQNWDDLKNTKSTLTQGNSLRAAGSLRRVPPEVADVCPVPADDRLHPALIASPVMRALCGEFETSRWILEVVGRVKQGTAEPQEHEALYRFLCSIHGRVGPKVRAELRTARVLRDHEGRWTEPASIMRSGAKGATMFAPVLRFPHADYAGDAEIAKSLKFREQVGSSDLLAYAEHVGRHPDQAAAFEQVVRRNARLLTDSMIGRLSLIPCLRSSAADGVTAPASLYVDTSRLRACLGDDAPYAQSGLSAALLERIGCRTNPRAGDILRHLARLREEGLAPEQPEVLYPELVQAAARETTGPGSLSDQQVLWTGTRWAEPSKTLLGVANDRHFGHAIPVAARFPPSVLAAYAALGATRSPELRHWRELLLWTGRQHQASGAPLSRAARDAVRRAYTEIGAHVDGLPEGAHVLLARDGTLHAHSDAQAGTFAIVDDVRMAEVIERDRIPIALADDQAVRSSGFLRAYGVPSLISLRKSVGYRTGEQKRPPQWLRLAEALDRIASPVFASAIVALVAHRLTRRGEPWAAEDLGRRLRAIEGIEYVAEIEEVFRIGQHTVTVPIRVRTATDRLYIAQVRGNSDLYGLLARAMVELLPGTMNPDFEHALYRLLTCEPTRELAHYLREQGVPWTPGLEDEDREAEDPQGDEEDTVLDELLTELAGSLVRGVQTEPRSTPPPPAPPTAASGPPPLPSPPETGTTKPLPPLDEVTAEMRIATESWQPPARHSGTGGEWKGWSGPTTRDAVRDAEVGRRGEELVLDLERKRVRALGQPESSVVWTSATTPLADHDIRSVDAEGNDVWVEVKATTGTSGRFQWSRGEFELALRARERYILYRVYQADSAHPRIKVFPNPVALFLRQGLRLDIGSLSAEVEPLE